MENQVQHDKENQKFYLIIDGSEALLEYRNIDDKTVEFYHTFTPNKLRGRGLAAQLVEAGFKFARENNYKIIPACSYVEAYLNRHQEYEDLRA